MSKVLILGDIHGQWLCADQTIDKAMSHEGNFDAIFCVGDVGHYWTTKKEDIWTTKYDIPIYWLDGNHECYPNMDLWKENKYGRTYIPRGSAHEIADLKILTCGGASSVDKAWRTQGVDWWPEEDITYRDIERGLSHEGPFDILLSHERPENYGWPFDFKDLRCGVSNRLALEAMVNEYKINMVFHGHYHVEHIGIFNGVTVVSCPIINMDCNYTILKDGEITGNWI